MGGSTNDYGLMKEIFNPELSWFKNINVWLDLGFLGAVDDYGKKAKIYLPHKKPRKSKSNPDPKLTPIQKEENRRQASIRVVVEHAIGGMKVFYCLAHRIRNHLECFVDSFFWLSAGLWNLKITKLTKT